MQDLTGAAKVTEAKSSWDGVLVWTALLLVLYALHEVFAVAFLTFLLTYLVRAIVVPLTRRISPDREPPSLERWLTLGTFVAIVALLWGLASLLVPQFVLQGRLLAAHGERLEPQEMLDNVLARSMGAYLFRQTYGAPGDPRYQAALDRFVAEGQVGTGAFASFGHLKVQVQAGFEIAYEGGARTRLDHQTPRRGDASPQFDRWFLEVKAPALVAERRASYLARLPTNATRPQPPDPGDLDRRLGELALKDLDGTPAERDRLVAEWEQAETAAQWRRLQASPEYRKAFEVWFASPAGMAAELPYDAGTYLALRDAYAEGMESFQKVYRERVAQTPAGLAHARLDFQRAKELDLAHQWWAASPAAASLREHLKQDASEAAAAITDRFVTGVRALIAVPAQVGVALLLTILISFDMVGLKRGAASAPTRPPRWRLCQGRPEFDDGRPAHRPILCRPRGDRSPEYTADRCPHATDRPAKRAPARLHRLHRQLHPGARRPPLGHPYRVAGLAAIGWIPGASPLRLARHRGHSCH